MFSVQLVLRHSGAGVSLGLFMRCMFNCCAAMHSHYISEQIDTHCLGLFCFFSGVREALCHKPPPTDIIRITQSDKLNTSFPLLFILLSGRLSLYSRSLKFKSLVFQTAVLLLIPNFLSLIALKIHKNPI